MMCDNMHQRTLDILVVSFSWLSFLEELQHKGLIIVIHTYNNVHWCALQPMCVCVW